MKRVPILLACAILPVLLQAQTKQSSEKKTAPVNQFDANGKKDGMWYSSEAARRGEDAYVEFGNYYHGRRAGLWYKLDEEDQLIAIENYKNNAKDGEAKYYDKGKLICVGHFRGLNPDHSYDTIMVVDPETGYDVPRVISSDRGSLKHGKWIYYDADNGRIVKEEEYQIDNLIFSKEYPLSRADSLFYANRNKNLPHVKNIKYAPPKNKQFSYTDYK